MMAMELKGEDINKVEEAIPIRTKFQFDFFKFHFFDLLTSFKGHNWSERQMTKRTLNHRYFVCGDCEEIFSLWGWEMLSEEEKSEKENDEIKIY